MGGREGGDGCFEGFGQSEELRKGKKVYFIDL